MSPNLIKQVISRLTVLTTCWRLIPVRERPRMTAWLTSSRWKFMKVRLMEHLNRIQNQFWLNWSRSKMLFGIIVRTWTSDMIVRLIDSSSHAENRADFPTEIDNGWMHDQFQPRKCSFRGSNWIDLVERGAQLWNAWAI